MNRLEELYGEAFDLGIDVLHIEIPVSGMDAAYLNANGSEKIFLRNEGTSNEQICWMAEELGHHYTGDSRILHYDCIKDWRAEARARRWAHIRLLSPDAIQTAARNSADIYDLADALGVTVQFLCEAIEAFQAKGNWLPICFANTADL